MTWRKVIPNLLTLTALAGLYAAWMWMRSPDALTGRPDWVIAFASLGGSGWATTCGG